MKMSEEEIKEKLYIKGIEAFNSHQFYDAHEYWEDLWSDYRLKDAKFIQGLIQLSVGYFHITNFNRNGALGLLKKCRGKLIDFSPIHRELDVNSIISKIDESLILIKTIEDKRKLNEFNWDLVPVLKNI